MTYDAMPAGSDVTGGSPASYTQIVSVTNSGAEVTFFNDRARFWYPPYDHDEAARCRAERARRKAEAWAKRQPKKKAEG